MGEYARSLAIAKGAQARWPAAAIQFIVSRAAPYAAQTPFPTILLESSPTFHTAKVTDVIAEWRPDVVLFDNAGRTAQLRAARRSGARVVYISARARQRRKAFRLSWMSLIDEHWIAYPEFIAGALGIFERFKLKVMRRPTVRYLDVILDSTSLGSGASMLARTGCAAGEYVLVVPGGGTGHPGARDSATQFLTAARGIAAGIDTVFVGPTGPLGAADRAAAEGAAAEGAAAEGAVSRVSAVGAVGAERVAGAARVAGLGATGGSSEVSRLRLVGGLPQAELGQLMRGARLIVTNGGSTLLQSIACGKPCVAVPIAGDQNERIKRCVDAGVAVAAPLDSTAILGAATALLTNERELAALAGRAVALGLRDGVDIALRALGALMTRSSLTNRQ
jgi:hypothetical protein